MKQMTNVLSRGGIVLTVVLTALALRTQAQQAPMPTQTPETATHRAKEFIEKASQGNAAEIALANVAENRAQNPQVKQLADMLRTDHQQANQQLETVAASHGVTMDTSLDFMNKHEVNRLEKADAADFDKEYTTLMLKDHVKDIKEYQDAISKMDEADVKQYAQTVLPKLREHLEKSEQAARAAGVEDSTISSIVKEVAVRSNGDELNRTAAMASTASTPNNTPAQPNPR